MFSTALGLLLLSLVSGDALIICGGELAHIQLETETVTSSVGMLHTYPNDIVIHDGYGFVTNSGSDDGTLQRFQMGTWTVTELGLGTGWNCWGALPLSSGQLAVSAALNNSITMVDPSSMTQGTTITGVGPNPEWMAEDQGKLYAACGGWGAGNSVVAVDIASSTVLDTLTAGTNCQSLTVADNGNLFVLCSGTYGSNEGAVVVIDPSTGSTLATLTVGGFPAWCAAGNGRLYTSDPYGAGVFSVDMETLTVLHDSSSPFCTGGNGLAFDDGGNLWVTDASTGEVRVYDPGENLVKTFSLANPGAIAVSGAYTGIETEIAPVTRIAVAPNPAVNIITVTGAQAGSDINIYDVTGRLAAVTQASASGETTLSINLRPGLYTAVCGENACRFAVTAR